MERLHSDYTVAMSAVMMFSAAPMMLLYDARVGRRSRSGSCGATGFLAGGHLCPDPVRGSGNTRAVVVGDSPAADADTPSVRRILGRISLIFRSSFQGAPLKDACLRQWPAAACCRAALIVMAGCGSGRP
ncbi:hypothetical protein [Ensifer canadensis]